MTEHEKTLFRAAKIKEWNSFVENSVVELCSSHGIDPRRVIGSRWVLTWKHVDGQVERNAKARLVLLGYQDPDLGAFAKSSPTLTRTARSMILALTAQFEWDLFSLDAKNAFLAGDLTSRSLSLYMRIPPDLRDMLQLPRDSVMRLLKSAYGLCEAPIAWFKHLEKTLRSLGWQSHPLDECLMTLYDNTGSVCGLVGIHVDDLLLSGSGAFFNNKMSELERRLPFGSRKYRKFTYCGLSISQASDKSITVDQFPYLEKLQPMPHKHLKPDKPIPASEYTNFKSLVGGLAWPTVNTRPDCAFDVSWLASKGVNATGNDIALGNKIQRRMQMSPVQLHYTKISKSVQDWRLVTFHDAGWATRPSLHSQAGAALFFADKAVLDGKLANAVLIDWLCAKIERVIRSSFECEINSAQLALDHMEVLSAMLAMILYRVSASQFRYYQRMNELQNIIPESALVGDNKGLYSAVQSANPITTKGEKRLTIDKLIMKETLKSNRVTYHWTNAGHQIADGFTKLSTAGARSDLLLDAIDKGQIRIHYSEESGRKEALRQREQLQQPLDLDSADQMYALDEDELEDGLSPPDRPDLTDADSWVKWHFDLI